MQHFAHASPLSKAKLVFLVGFCNNVDVCAQLFQHVVEVEQE